MPDSPEGSSSDATADAGMQAHADEPGKRDRESDCESAASTASGDEDGGAKRPRLESDMVTAGTGAEAGHGTAAASAEAAIAELRQDQTRMATAFEEITRSFDAELAECTRGLDKLEEKIADQGEQLEAVAGSIAAQDEKLAAIERGTAGNAMQLQAAAERLKLLDKQQQVIGKDIAALEKRVRIQGEAQDQLREDVDAMLPAMAYLHRSMRGEGIGSMWSSCGQPAEADPAAGAGGTLRKRPQS